MEALNEVLSKSSSLRKVAAKYSFNCITLQRLCKKFEQGNVGDTFIAFYSNLAKHKFQCHDIYSLDETAETNVQKTIRIVAKKRMSSDRRRESLSGHQGCGYRPEWEFYPAILCIPTKELQELLHCKGTR
jgi:hypothetical protein